MNSLIDAAINRSRTTFLILVMILLAGTAARIAIPIEAQPRIEVPFIVVIVPHEGISPEDSERLLVLPLETELRAVEGVKELKAYAAEGSATITVEFDADFDLDRASIKVRDAVDRAKPKLPSTAEEPIIAEQSTDDWPIIQINLLGEDVPERVIYQSALALRDNLEAIPEVMEATLSGDRE